MEKVVEDYANRDIIKEWIEIHPGVFVQKNADSIRVRTLAVEESVLYLEKEGKIEN